MSLLGNRGRFTQDKNEYLSNSSSEFSSALALIGKNPIKMFHIISKKHEDDNKKKLKNINLNNSDDRVNEHLEYNKKVNKLNSKIEHESNSSRINNYPKKKKSSLKLFVAMFVVEVLTIVGIYFVGSIYRYSNLTQSIPFNIKNVENTDITESTLAIMKGYKTVAIFGVDSRTGSVDKGNNADVNMIVNLNLETGDAQLVSVYRDLYLSITDNNTYDKLNAAYRKGGPEQAVKSLNKNFDLNIDSYFAFNWKAVADGIELLGGIDLEITKAEFTYMNAFIHETCIATGIDAKNPAAHYIKKTGMQHLDGVQAVAYGRLRLMDSDFQRVERQKKVIALCLEKAKTLDIPKLRLIVEAVLPQIAYAFDMNEMLSILRIVRTVNITESAGCPDVNNIVTMSMGGSGDCIVPLNLEKAVKKLHYILYNVDDYTPSNAVKRYSNRIIELRTKYAEENRVKESLKNEESAEHEESVKSEVNKPVVPIISTKSTVKKAETETESEEEMKQTDNSSETTAEEYPDEPEFDAPIVSNKPINTPPPNDSPISSTPFDNSPFNATPINELPKVEDFTVYDAPGVPRGQGSSTINEGPAVVPIIPFPNPS